MLPRGILKISTKHEPRLDIMHISRVVIVKKSACVTYQATVIGKWYDHSLTTTELVIRPTVYHAARIVFGYVSIPEILPVYWHVGIYQGEFFRQITVFKFYALHCVEGALPII
jgi:hypothetical protein